MGFPRRRGFGEAVAVEACLHRGIWDRAADVLCKHPLLMGINICPGGNKKRGTDAGDMGTVVIAIESIIG